MRIIHFSDTHVDFGKSMGPIDPDTRLSGRVLDNLDMIDSIIDFATEEQVDLIIFSGDAFHQYNPNPIYLNAFAKRLSKMRQLCPVVVLVGNHDMSVATSAVEIYSSIELDNVIVGNEYKVHKIQTKSGLIQVATAPYPPRKSRKNIQDMIYALGDEITDEGPAILTGHFTVSGSRYGAERDYVFGDDAEVALELLADPVWDYVALGHIHYHQCLNEHPPVVYAGSTDRVTFGEENEDKGFVCINIVDGVTTWEFIQLDARPYITLKIKTLSNNPMEKILAKIENTDISRAVVRVIIAVKEQYRQLVYDKAILEALEASGLYILASLVISEIKAERETSARMIATSGMLEASSTIEQLQIYLESIGISDKDMKELMPIAKEIMTDVQIK